MERILSLDWDPLHFLNKMEMPITISLRCGLLKTSTEETHQVTTN